ncbi:TetR family transcriptional regulator [Roseomonas xinghualingensis]|uniref:TetR family transcriptional regulator n=1 Tax=Roseomonas xinghualingensis TaxID=2986475 RepID=UPI0021F10C0C|nr:TetR family transcriptional regulator [Roseomonas sp. SXEYE001]MCV4206372.1 TetR family transcriptional regulator [Roseomonas sp. SXEYE001]
MNTRDAPSPELLDAFWRVVALHGWHGTTFARIAAQGGEGLADLRGRYATPVDLLRAHARAVDQAVLEGTVPGQFGFGSARDRVFDLLMRRFDMLAPHREGVLRLQRDLRRDPLSALLLSPILMASMAWTLEGAGISTAGIPGALRVQGLTGVWLSAARAWEDDDSVDLGPTMAALDRALDRAEKVARTLRLSEEEPQEAPGPVEGADSMPPDVVDPPLADTGIMMADASGAQDAGHRPEPLPPAVLTPPTANDPEAPGAPPTPKPPRKTGGTGSLPSA